MDLSTASTGAKVKAMLPKIPLMLKTTALHSLSISQTAKKWDLGTALIVTVIRSFLTSADPTPVSQSQRVSLRDPGVKGNLWVSRVAVPKPAEDDVTQLVFKAVARLNQGGETYTPPELQGVEAEWTGFRADAKSDAPELEIGEEEKYARLLKEVTGDTVILYFHGGAHYMMDPATHRHVTSRLAKETGGRVLSVRYRLAPQNPFPAALLDALVCYLALLNPPAGSLHSAIPASKIVFAGDSAGGNLAAALLQLILQFHRDSSSPTVTFNGVSVSIPLPGAIAVNSPWMDVTHAMPSFKSNAKFDYLPTVSDEGQKRIPPCPIWPANPPRADMYCDGSAMCHPLVSPLAAMDWTGSPPVYFVCGQEMLSDEGAVVMQRMARQGVTVVWEQYEAMPHCFALILDRIGATAACFESWAAFCKDVAEGKTIASKGTFVTAKKLERTDVDVTKLVDLKDEDVLKMMSDVRDGRIKQMEKKLASEQPKL